MRTREKSRYRRPPTEIDRIGICSGTRIQSTAKLLGQTRHFGSTWQIRTNCGELVNRSFGKNLSTGALFIPAPSSPTGPPSLPLQLPPMVFRTRLRYDFSLRGWSAADLSLPQLMKRRERSTAGICLCFSSSVFVSDRSERERERFLLSLAPPSVLISSSVCSRDPWLLGKVNKRNASRRMVLISSSAPQTYVPSRRTSRFLTS